jgi:hypothetical protein
VDKTNPRVTTGHLWRSLIPSSTSGIICLLAGVLTVIVGVLQAASNQGTALEGVTAGSGTKVPLLSSLDRILSRGSWGDILALAVWVLGLVVVCALAEFLSGSYAKVHTVSEKGDDRSARLDAAERRWLLGRAYLRLCVGLVAIAAAYGLIRLIHWSSTAEMTQVGYLQLYLQEAVWRMAAAAIIWAVTFHLSVVFIRLYLFRTRIFRGKRVNSD